MVVSPPSQILTTPTLKLRCADAGGPVTGCTCLPLIPLPAWTHSRLSPLGEHFNDGLTLDPLEVMFVKVKSYTLMNGVTSAQKAVKYQQWMHVGMPCM